MGESPFNPVTPAFANALRDASGVRFTEMPVPRDRVRLALDRHARASVTEGRAFGALLREVVGGARRHRSDQLVVSPIQLAYATDNPP